MAGSQREDFVLRQLKVIAAMLARIAGLRLGGTAEEAKAELEQAYGLLLGPQSEFLRRVDPSTAAALLGSKEEIELFAQLLDEEALLVGDKGRRLVLQRQAAELRRHARRRNPTRGS
jgi:hypothetical protein